MLNLELETRFFFMLLSQINELYVCLVIYMQELLCLLIRNKANECGFKSKIIKLNFSFWTHTNENYKSKCIHNGWFYLDLFQKRKRNAIMKFCCNMIIVKIVYIINQFWQLAPYWRKVSGIIFEKISRRVNNGNLMFFHGD